MDANYWEKFKILLREAVGPKFQFFLPGSIIGLLSGKSLLFSSLPAEVVTFGAFCIKFMGTIIMAAGSGLATTWAAKWMGNRMDKNQKKSPREKENDKAA